MTTRDEEGKVPAWRKEEELSTTPWREKKRTATVHNVESALGDTDGLRTTVSFYFAVLTWRLSSHRKHYTAMRRVWRTEQSALTPEIHRLIEIMRFRLASAIRRSVKGHVDTQLGESNENGKWDV